MSLLYPIPQQARVNMSAFERNIKLYFVSFQVYQDGCVSLFEKRVRAHSQTQAIQIARAEVRIEYPLAEVVQFTGVRQCL